MKFLVSSSLPTRLSHLSIYSIPQSLELQSVEWNHSISHWIAHQTQATVRVFIPHRYRQPMSYIELHRVFEWFIKLLMIVHNAFNVLSLIVTLFYNSYLDYNQLSGTIPSIIGSIASLLELYDQYNTTQHNAFNLLSLIVTLFCASDLDVNQLSGTIPSELGSLTKLVNLYESSCFTNVDNQWATSNSIEYFEWSIKPLMIVQSAFNLLSLIVTLFYHSYLNNNQLSGTIPSSIGSIASLSVMYDSHFLW